MEVERRDNHIFVSLSSEEVFSLQDGHTIYGKPGITPDAKVEVLPLSAIEPDKSLEDRYSLDRLEKARASQLKAHLLPSEDLQIFVPAIKLTDVRVAGGMLLKEQIETPLAGTRNDEQVNHVIPEKGIVLTFGGSLRTIKPMHEFYQ